MIYLCFMIILFGCHLTDAFETSSSLAGFARSTNAWRAASSLESSRSHQLWNNDGPFRKRRRMIITTANNYNNDSFVRNNGSLLLASSNGDSNNNNNDDDGGGRKKDGRPSVSFSSSPFRSGGSGDSKDVGGVEGSMSSPTAALDFVLSIVTSDLASIVLGLIGLTVCIYTRLSSSMEVDALGQQSRADLLAVFASGSVLLNGISKLDVTSALAETVALEGISLSQPELLPNPKNLLQLNNNNNNNDDDDSKKNDLLWAVQSSLDATPAKTAIVMVYDDDQKEWIPTILSGIVPSTQRELIQPSSRATPILDRMAEATKESYLPTLQALPGKVEFTYLPSNTQLALLVPIPNKKAALVLGSDTAKSFTPRDVAWCQVIATRMGTFLDS